MKQCWIAFCRFIATGFGVGYLPYAPGTWGTLVAIPLYLLIIKFVPNYFYAIVIAGFLLGNLVCDVATKSFNTQDDSRIVWDEIVGFWITMLFVPSLLWVIVLGFILFRLFDVIKPWPIKYFDKHVHGGFGIMLDDVLAGIFSAAILYGCYYIKMHGGI